MKNKYPCIILLFLTIQMTAIPVWSQSAGGPYIGQPAPGEIPEPFAVGFLPTTAPSITFATDGLECYFTNWNPPNSFFIMTTHENNGSWTDPDTASFSGDNDQGPALSPDDGRLFFVSYRPIPGLPYLRLHLWFTDRLSASWSDPVPVDSPVKEHYIISSSVAGNGNLYLSIVDDEPQISVSRLVNGIYQEPEKLSDSIHYLNRPMRPHIAPDESYIIFDAGETPDPLSQRDLYISYRKQDLSWTMAVKLNDFINTGDDETSPFLTRDNQFLFFSRNGIQYWVNADQITAAESHTTFISGYSLEQNFPNPVNDKTTIRYTLPGEDYISLTVYNMLHQRVALLTDGIRQGGNHSLTFEPASLPAGVYEYVLKTTRGTLTRKMIIYSFQRHASR